MINELYTLSQCLQRCGIQFGKPHPDVKTPGKSEGFIVEINKNGMLETLKYVSAKDIAKLWTLRKGKHNSFPFVKLKKPVWDIPFDDPARDELKKMKRNSVEKKSKLQNVCKKRKLNKQGIGLASWTKKRIDCIRNKDEEINAIVDLVDRFSIIEKSQEKFFGKFSELIFKEVNEQFADIAATILIGNIKERGREIVCDVPLFFDISDWDKYSCRVADPKMGVLVGKYLPQELSDKSVEGISALEGITKSLHSG
ncbi:MAG: hypothetical protein WC412_08490, partial [Candidatus Omnitrophota bacterium]